jgi:hypothetical protein
VLNPTDHLPTIEFETVPCIPQPCAIETREGGRSDVQRRIEGHPNSFAFINHFDWKTDLRNMPKATFGKPSRNLLTLCLPAASIAVTAFLDSMGKLIGSVGDKELFGTIENVIHELVGQGKAESRRDVSA